MPRILLVLSSHNRVGPHGPATGVWIDDFAVPWFDYTDAGHEVVVVTPQGGRPPIDRLCLAETSRSPITERFMADPSADLALTTTIRLADLGSGTFDALHIPGGYGLLTDLANDKTMLDLLADFDTAGTPIGMVGQAAGLLSRARTPDGHPLARGRRVTGFSRDEEASIDFLGLGAYVVEDSLRECGALYSCNAMDWAAYTVRDRNLVTGQNPASAHQVTHLILDMLAE